MSLIEELRVPLRTYYSDQQNSCYQQLIFNQSGSLFITGTGLYYMPQLAARTDIACSESSWSRGTASGSFH